MPSSLNFNICSVRKTRLLISAEKTAESEEGELISLNSQEGFVSKGFLDGPLQEIEQRTMVYSANRKINTKGLTQVQDILKVKDG